MRLSNVSKRCKLLALGAAAVLSLGLMAGCGSSDQSASSGSGKNYKIGIVQLVEHNALDAANKGFVDGLKERGFEEGKNITIDRQNAQADQSNLQNIAQRFVSAKMDLICAIATPAAQTMANATHDIPIVGTNTVLARIAPAPSMGRASITPELLVVGRAAALPCVIKETASCPTGLALICSHTICPLLLAMLFGRLRPIFPKPTPNGNLPRNHCS